MDEYVYPIKNAMNDGDYEKALKILNKYLDDGNGIAFNIILYYLECLNRLGYKEKAYSLIKNILSNDHNHNSFYIPFLYYLHKFEDVFEIHQNNKLSNYAKMYVADSYLVTSNINKAKELYNEIINDSNDEVIIGHCKEKLNHIDNHEKYHSFLKTDYEYFSKNGNFLGPGHVVYLKDLNDGDFNEDLKTDDKKNNRPYLILEINRYTITIFPISSKEKSSYCIKKEFYPNVGIDRYVKLDGISKTSVINVETVLDRLNKNDTSIVLKEVYNYLYYNDVPLGKEFVRRNAPKVEQGNIMKIVSKTENGYEDHYYYVFYVFDDKYDVIEIDDKNNIIGKPIYLSKDNIPYIVNSENKIDDMCLKRVKDEYKRN